ncbi:ATP-binding protein [Anaerovibrio sp.]|uniref:ATP-binding protein n=1 Tax=Anaerovibrio sp. TaxID=1872532 RepID=UPI00388EE3E5
MLKDVKFSGKILEQVRDAIAFVKTQIREYTKLGKGAVFTTVPELPEFCWTELLVNAIAHRDYSVKGTDIQVKMFDDHFVVESPGVLPGMVTINNIREFHFSRNPQIVEYLNEYDFVKEFGEGVDRIYRDMEAAGLPEPVYKQREFMLYAELRNRNWGKDLSMYEATSQDVDVPQDVPQDGEKSNYAETILNMIQENPKVTRAEMAKALKVSMKTIGREIKKMPQIRYIGQGYSGHWEVK